MHKTMAFLAALTLVLAVIAGPALAAKKREGSFTATAIPYPLLPDGCRESAEGVNKVSEPFKAPFDGFLTVTMVDFQGDWDLFLNDPEGNFLEASDDAQLEGAPPTEELVYGLHKSEEVLMVPCNWGGTPTATVNWQFVARKF